MGKRIALSVGLIIVVSIIALAFGNKTKSSNNPSKKDAAQVAAIKDSVWIKVKVEGMTCGGCERSVEAHVKNVDGVLDAKADHKLKETNILVSDKNMGLENLHAAIKKAGYEIISADSSAVDSANTSSI